MSIEREYTNELDNILDSIRRAEQNIIGKDSPNKLKIVGRLAELEEAVKAIRDDITIPTLDVTEDTLIINLQDEKLLSVRAGNVLRRSGCKTVGDITSHTAHEIETMRNMGKKAADEIVEFLKANGLSLKG